MEVISETSSLSYLNRLFYGTSSTHPPRSGEGEHPLDRRSRAGVNPIESRRVPKHIRLHSHSAYLRS